VKAPIKVGLIGEGVEAGRLAEAIKTIPDLELAATAAADKADEVIRTPGLQAVEIVAPVDKRFGIAAAAIKAGLFVSVEAPASANELFDLDRLAQSYKFPLRVRLLPFYYPPFTEAKRLTAEDAAGLPMFIKMCARYGKGAAWPAEIDPASWVREHDLGFLALAPWIMGPVEKVHARLEKSPSSAPRSAVISWKHAASHRFGYLQLDFCPGLHVRSFHEPVHRLIEITGVGGLIFANRGEGQLLRQPSLHVHGKSISTIFEILPDDWDEVYLNLARETVQVLRQAAQPLSSPPLAAQGLSLLQAAVKSAEKGDEVEN
jgi:predicted dehydrogenase